MTSSGLPNGLAQVLEAQRAGYQHLSVSWYILRSRTQSCEISCERKRHILWVAAPSDVSHMICPFLSQHFDAICSLRYYSCCLNTCMQSLPGSGLYVRANSGSPGAANILTPVVSKCCNKEIPHILVFVCFCLCFIGRRPNSKTFKRPLCGNTSVQSLPAHAIAVHDCRLS